MPREVRAAYRRTFQVRPYETETVELSITDELLDRATMTDRELAEVVGQLHRALAEVGDQVVVARMESAPQSSPDPSTIRTGYRPGVTRLTDPWTS